MCVSTPKDNVTKEDVCFHQAADNWLWSTTPSTWTSSLLTLGANRDFVSLSCLLPYFLLETIMFHNFPPNFAQLFVPNYSTALSLINANWDVIDGTQTVCGQIWSSPRCWWLAIQRLLSQRSVWNSLQTTELLRPQVFIQLPVEPTISNSFCYCLLQNTHLKWASFKINWLHVI